MSTAQNRIRELLDAHYEQKRAQLPALVTSAPLVDGRSTGYVVATVGGVAGVRVNVSADLRSPVTAGDSIWVEGIGTPAATIYRMAERVSGDRPASDVYVFPEGGNTGNGTFAPGDILLGGTTDGWANWWYEYAAGRWRMRYGEIEHGAIGNLAGLYDYAEDAGAVYGAAFGLYEAGATWIATDEYNGFRIMNFDTRTFVVNPEGLARFGRDGEVEIVIDPSTNQIVFTAAGETQMAIDAQGRTIYGLERLGRPLGPCVEWGPIPDPSGDERLERMGFWVRDATERFFGVWSGNDVDPQDAGLRIGAQGADAYLDFSNGDLDIAARMNILGDSQITGDLSIVDGKLTWANGLHTANATGLHLGIPEIGVGFTSLFDVPSAGLTGGISVVEVSAGQEMLRGSVLRFQVLGFDSFITGGSCVMEFRAASSFDGTGPTAFMYLEAIEVPAGGATRLYCSVDQAVFLGYVQIPSDNAFYLGSPIANDSWRIIRSGTDLQMERREAGAWVVKQVISA